MWGWLWSMRRSCPEVSRVIGVRWQRGWGHLKAFFTHLYGAWAKKTQTMRDGTSGAPWHHLQQWSVCVCSWVCISPWVPPHSSLRIDYLHAAESAHIQYPTRYWEKLHGLFWHPSEIKQHHLGHILSLWSSNKFLKRFKGRGHRLYLLKEKMSKHLWKYFKTTTEMNKNF